MRLILTLLAAGSLLLSAAAVHANTIAFGGLTNNTSCSLAGNGADRSCTDTASVTNGALDANASVNVRGQASADHGLTTNPTAIADILVSYTVPYTLTRDVTFNPLGGGAYDAIVPLQTITFDVTYSGNTATDNSQVTGGLGNAAAYGSSTTGSFGISIGTGGFGGGSDSFVTTLNQSGGPIVEVSVAGDLPTSYLSWTDDVFPSVDYGAVGTLTQSLTGSLTMSFRLRAESRPSGSISVTGGEAIACAGQGSDLGSFDLNPNCGTGLTVDATSAVTGSTSFLVPEPGTLALLGAGLAGLAYAARRKLG